MNTSPTENIIYNVTVKIEAANAEEWLHWLLQEHLTEVMATGCFTHYKVVRLLEVDDSDGPTYAIQYTAPSMANYSRYIETYAGALRQKTIDKWGNSIIAFRSVMQVIAEST